MFLFVASMKDGVSTKSRLRIEASFAARSSTLTDIRSRAIVFV